MCKMVLIDSSNYKAGKNEIGDMLSVYEDDVEVNYGDVVPVENVTKAELEAELESELKTILKVFSDDGGSTWHLSIASPSQKPDEKEVYVDGSENYREVTRPTGKYRHNFAGLTAQSRTDLADPAKTSVEQLAIINAACDCHLVFDEANDPIVSVS